MSVAFACYHVEGTRHCYVKTNEDNTLRVCESEGARRLIGWNYGVRPRTENDYETQRSTRDYHATRYSYVSSNRSQTTEMRLRVE